MKKVLVIGSVNIDIFTQLERLPQIGETVFAGDSFKALGGKGANQAIACANFLGDVSFLGAISADDEQGLIIDNFQAHGVKIDKLAFVKDQITGLANVYSIAGDNAIIINQGANKLVDAQLIKANEDYIKDFDYLLLQNEVAESTLGAVIALKEKYPEIKIILNPAPFRMLNEELLKGIDLLTPNESEYAELVEKLDISEMEDKFLITLGSKGVTYKDKTFTTLKVDVQDTTGAGDAFNGYLVALLSRDFTMEKAIEHAMYGASFSVEKVGAQAGLLKWDDYLEKLQLVK